MEDNKKESKVSFCYFLAHLYECTDIAIAVTTASMFVLASVLALHKMFLVKVFRCLSSEALAGSC